ncbi:MAG: class I SAM-dependent methyltransferase [Ignavibacteria bacterium]
MNNEWQKIDLTDYENHMSVSLVFQLQTLNKITQKQINDYHPSSLVFIGVAGGNGLEYCKNIKKVYAIDINKNYLDICSKRFPYENIKYILMDVNKDEFNLINIDLVISNLVFEYLNEEVVIPKILRILKKGGVLSIVFQISTQNSFISTSKYSSKFTYLEKIHHNVNENYLQTLLNLNGFTKIFDESYLLPNGVILKRFDSMLV